MMSKRAYQLIIFLAIAFFFVFNPRLIFAQTCFPGDASGDGQVTVADYVIWLNHYDQTTTGGCVDGDFSGDNEVTGVDYVIWSNHYGQTAGTPTPSSSGFTGISAGQTVSGDIFVTYEADASVTQNVHFYIDGNSERTESVYPYCLAGDTNGVVTAYDTTQLSNGQHTISVVVTRNNGSTYNDQVTVNVDNQVINPSLTPTPTTASGTATVSISPSSSSISSIGGTRTVNVNIGNAVKLGGFEFEVHYNPSIVKVASVGNVTLGSFLGSTGRSATLLTPIIDNTNGMVKVGAFSFGSTDGPSGSGTLASITFTGTGNGTTSLNIQNILLSSSDTTPVNQPSTAYNGSITVGSGGPTNTPIPSPTPTPIATGGGGGSPYKDLLGSSFDLVPSTPYREIPVEIQAWWLHNPPDGNGFGHEHVLCFWPVGQSISGTLSTNCRMVMHNNPSTMKKLAFHLAPGDVIKTISLGFNCPYGGDITHSTTCSWNVPVSLNTSSWPSGWRHLRIRAVQSTPDGNTWTTSSELPFQIGGGTNGGEFPWCIGDPSNNETCLIGKSWYTNFAYQNVAIKNIPLVPVKGNLTLSFANTKGPSQLLEVALDKSHDVPAVGPWGPEHMLPGSILLHKENPGLKNYYNVSIDTTKLANGWHSVSARSMDAEGASSSCSYCDNGTNFESGIAKIWFFVNN